MGRSALLTATVIAAVVFAGSTPAQAADANAIKRAIVITVLNNLGVEPTAQLVNELVADIPIDALDSGLVARVGKALDNSSDPTTIISETVDSDGDGIPNADATVDDDELVEDESDDNESGSGGSSGNSGTSGGAGGSSSNNSDDEQDEPEDDEGDEGDEDEPEDEDDGDEEDN